MLTQSYPFHALADAFPLIEGAEFDELVSSIKANGLFDPITLLDGTIIDGRNRYRACLVAGIEPTFDTYDGDEPAAFVVARNINRRHLNSSQRAMIAAKLATIPHGGSAHRASEGKTGIPVMLLREAAELVNVNKDTVSDARLVLAEGTPEEIRAVEQGTGAVSTLAKQIRAGDDHEKRKAYKPGNAIAHAQNVNAEIWSQFRDALNLLAGLPHPDDVLKSVSGGSRSKTAIVSDRLPVALQWLTDFSNLWNHTNG